jgi:uncharacterized protein (TIGR04551 family)
VKRAPAILASALALAAALAGPAAADEPAPGPTDRATFGTQGQELSARRFASPRESTQVQVAGYLRLRGEALYNLDLDHGLTPSGLPLFPVPLANPAGQTLAGADTRLRTDLALYPRGAGVAVKLRVDVLDNLILGSTPEGVPATSRAPSPAASPGQRAPEQALRVKRAWGEVLTPVGLVSAGRMGGDWGLGMVANGGDCFDCDGGDAADRIALVTPLVGHLWAVSYDFSASGPTTERRDQVRALDLDPTDDVRSLTFAVLRYRTDAARARRRAAGRTSVEYGAYVSHRRQESDVPAHYLPTAAVGPIGPMQVMARGFRATIADAWFRITTPRLRVEAEAAYLSATVEQPSLIPGVLLEQRVTSDQLGLAVESDYLVAGGAASFGLNFGYASGDPAPGFGAFPTPGAPAPQPGDLDGPQANLPDDTRVDNFRFHPDYRVDRILFREIIGTVTDAVYLRPHGRLTVADLGHARLTATLAVIVSWAVEPTSTPGGARALGVEIDPGLSYVTRDGFRASLEYALFVPGAGFDNPGDGLTARPAQLARLTLGYLF